MLKHYSNWSMDYKCHYMRKIIFILISSMKLLKELVSMLMEHWHFLKIALVNLKQKELKNLENIN